MSNKIISYFTGYSVGYFTGYSVGYSITYFWFQNGFTGINQPDYDKLAKSKKFTHLKYSIVWPLFSQIIVYDCFCKAENYMNKLLEPKDFK